MSEILVRCLREGCNNYRHSSAPLGICYPCREYMIDTARTIRESTKNVAYKSKADMMKFEYSVCSVKSCKKRLFMRNRCRKHYIDFMSNIDKH